jgi:tetratricopeptide (TPR) repeat protein
LRKLGKTEEALESINRAIVLNPSYTSAYTHRASLFLSQGKLEEARADYERVVSLYAGGRAPDTTLAYSRVLAHVFAGKWDEGVKHAEEMIRQHPDDGDWLYDMACAYSIAAEVASIDKRLDAATREEKSKVLARRAFEVLEKAIDAGYEDFEHMRKDPDFNFINQDARFKKLGVTE